MQKRGATQIDWVISLAVFIIFLLVFFLSIRPSILPISPAKETTSNLAENFFSTVGWTIDKFPGFTNSDLNEEVVIVEIEQSSFIAVLDRYFTFRDNKLFFLADLSQESTFFVVRGEENYSRPKFTKLFKADEEEFDSGKFEFGIYGGLIQNVLYGGSLIDDIDYKLDGNSFSPSENSFYEDKLLAHYTGGLLSCFGIHNFPRVYCFVKQEIDLDFDLNFEMDDDLQEWNVLYGGAIVSGSGGTHSFPGVRFVSFDDGDRGVSYLFSPAADIDFSNSSSMDLDVAFDDVESFNYTIIAHDADDGFNLLNPYNLDIGLVSQIKGLSLEEMIALPDASVLRQLWGIQSDFSVEVVQDGLTIFEVNSSTPTDVDNVFVEKRVEFLLDKFGNLTPVEVFLRVW